MHIISKVFRGVLCEAGLLSAAPAKAMTMAMAMARARLVELIVFEEIELFPHAINGNQLILSGRRHTRCESCFLIYLCKYNE